MDGNNLKKNYGSTSESNDQGSDDFGYVEFSGKGGRTCPTCNGTGVIAKHHEEELVALIPYNDRRLKPSRTKCYVILAIAICSIGSALALFFLLPRAVTIEEDRILKTNVSINTDISATTISFQNLFNITNTNYFAVDVFAINIEVFFDRVQVGKSSLPNPPLRIGARTYNFPVKVNIVACFNQNDQLGYVADLCTNPKRKVHDIVIVLQVTQSVTYLQHSEQYSMTTYQYIDCSTMKYKH